MHTDKLIKFKDKIVNRLNKEEINELNKIIKNLESSYKDNSHTNPINDASYWSGMK